MASQFFETAIVNFRNKKHFIVPTVSSFDNSIETTGEDGEQVFVNREAYASQIQTDVLVSQQSVTSISSAVLVSGGITDFRIEPGCVDTAAYIYLAVNVTNNTGSNIVLSPIQGWLNYLYAYGQNGTDQLYSMWAVESWLTNRFFDYAEWLQAAPLVGSTSTYGYAGNTIAAAASATYYLPIPLLFISSRLFFAGIQQPLLLRFNWNNSGLTTISGGSITVNQMTLLLHGRFIQPKDRQIKMAQYGKNLDFPFMSTQRISIQFPTITYGTQYTQILSGLTCLCSSITITFRDVTTGISAANQFDFLNVIASYDVQSNNGTSINGGYFRLVNSTTGQDDAALVALITGNDNTWYANTNALTNAWSRGESQTLKTGSSFGFSSMTGFEKIIFTAGSSGFTSGHSFQMDVWANALQTCKIRNRRITASQ